MKKVVENIIEYVNGQKEMYIEGKKNVREEMKKENSFKINNTSQNTCTIYIPNLIKIEIGSLTTVLTSNPKSLRINMHGWRSAPD